jgi:hypothetical protein
MWLGDRLESDFERVWVEDFFWIDVGCGTGWGVGSAGAGGFEDACS